MEGQVAWEVHSIAKNDITRHKKEEPVLYPVTNRGSQGQATTKRWRQVGHRSVKCVMDSGLHVCAYAIVKINICVTCVLA
jgi:hypothetical protein